MSVVKDFVIPGAIVFCLPSIISAYAESDDWRAALPLEVAMESSSLPSTDQESKVDLFAAQTRIEAAYGRPVCFEWPFVREDRTALPAESIALEIRSDQPLNSTLQAIETDQSDVLRVDAEYGIPVVRSENANVRQENCLDVLVSVKLDGLSTWEALKSLARAVNAQEGAPRRLEVWPEFLSDGSEAIPGFAEGDSIHIELNDVPARQVLCQIIQDSPVVFSYTYSNHYRPDLTSSSRPLGRLNLRFFENNKLYRSQGRMPRAKLVEWMNEIEALATPAPGVNQ